MAAKDLKPDVQMQLADLALAVAYNPKTRAEFAGLLKKAEIPIKLNDVETEERVIGRVAEEVESALAKAARKRESEATVARLNEQRARLIRSESNPNGRFTEDVVKTKLEPFMEANGIADYENGAILFAHHHPDTTPHQEQTAAHFWQMPTGDVLSDPKGSARAQANKAVADIIAHRR